MTNIFGKHDDKTIAEFRDVESRSVKAALMADGHVSTHIFPVGGVAAYYDMVPILGVGVDIACGNCAIRLDVNISDLGKSEPKRKFMLEGIANEIASTISFGMGRNNKSEDAPDEHGLFNSPRWAILKDRAGHGQARAIYDKAKQQLGTVGGGNHYVDVFADEKGAIWVGDHFGSRGLGHNIFTGFNTLAAGGIWGDKTPEHEGLISLKSSLGQDYWELMQLAGEYAYAGREWVTEKVQRIFGTSITDRVHNNHNFAWKESQWVPTLDGGMEWREVVVVRKGATPAFPGQRGFVGGSMGDISVILKGREGTPNDMLDSGALTKQLDALFSTVHGAGRVMSRTEAKGKTNRKTGQLKLDAEGNPVKAPRVTTEMMDEWVGKMGVIRRGGDVDEAPHVYRRLPEVLSEQGPTIEIEHTLTPLIAVMASPGVFDPYRD
jgi:tRNA-splicing ligase RtcB